MIQKFIDAFMEGKDTLKDAYSLKHPADYAQIVSDVVKLLDRAGEDRDVPDPDRITCIDHGDYQGTLLFIVGAKGYQPSRYWSVFVNYGSCSGCDTLEAIRNYSYEAPKPRQVDAYMTLALHIVQGIKQLDNEARLYDND